MDLKRRQEPIRYRLTRNYRNINNICNINKRKKYVLNQISDMVICEK